MTGGHNPGSLALYRRWVTSRQGFLSWWARWYRWVFRPRLRVTGPPPSGNGASSFHLHWQFSPTAPLVGVQATLEIVEPPAVDSLYFWALQASFGDGRRNHGSGHIGLQWNQRHPDHTAANWGGYHTSGRILDGSGSPLPSAPQDPNTRDFPWQSGRPYRLRITRAEAGWRGEIADLITGYSVVIRDLYSPGDRLMAPTVWSEVFANCDAPRVVARWSGLQGLTVDGEVVTARAARVNYQAYEAGGCSNTTSLLDGDGIVQVTNAERSVPQGTTLSGFANLA